VNKGISPLKTSKYVLTVDGESVDFTMATKSERRNVFESCQRSVLQFLYKQSKNTLKGGNDQVMLLHHDVVPLAYRRQEAAFGDKTEETKRRAKVVNLE
jgi:hypothetical protein